MLNVFRRLAAMSGDEVRWRLRTSVRNSVDRLSASVRTPAWKRSAIAEALAVDTLPAAMQQAIAAEEWTDLHHQLATLIAGRRPRFVLDPASMAAVRAQVALRWPDAAADAVDRATHVIEGRLDLLGHRQLVCSEPGGAIDWHRDPVHERSVPVQFWTCVPYLDPAWGDHKVIWEVNRQQHWLVLSRALWLTGDHFYAREIVRDFYSWLEANPPLMGANWASMLELAFRSLSWLWGLHAWLAVAPSEEAGEEPWLVDLLVALDRQLTQVERNLSRYFSPNTHLTGEALALYVAGTALPELAASARWIDVGRAVLLREIDRQIEPDGGHAERSTHYHRYTLDFYLLALVTARRSGDLDAELRFTEAVERLVPFALAMADSSGRLPRIGDDDAGMLWPITGRDASDIRDSLAIAATLLDRPDWARWGMTEEAVWVGMAGEADLPHPPVTDSERITSVFPSTGYVTTRTPEGDHLIVDVGPHGYLNGGHAHADALAMTLSLRGLPLLVDPGTPTYTMDPGLRDHLRSSSSHNTLTLDGWSSATPAGPFHWRTRADARLEIARANPHFTLIEGAHDAYGDIRHRRVVLAAATGYVVVDQVTGAGDHEAALHWHFDPRWRVRCESERCLRLESARGAGSPATADAVLGWLVSDSGALWLVHGDEESRLGFVSPAYGVRVPAWTARVTHRGQLPFAMVTWVSAGREGYVPHLERLSTEKSVVAVRLVQGIDEQFTMVRPGAPTEPAGCEAADFTTDARALQYAVAGGRLRAFSAVDVAHALALREGLISVSSEVRVPDLHVERLGDPLPLAATAPPPRLQLEGAVVTGAAVITLNGREFVRPAGGRRDRLMIAAGDWAQFRTVDADPNSEHELSIEHRDA
jgi:hypothetical protein